LTAAHIDNKMNATENETKPDDSALETSLTDALASLSLTTELDSALLDHLNLLDKYMFHMECLSQLFRMVYAPSHTNPGIL
jgi:hypothetical protein